MKLLVLFFHLYIFDKPFIMVVEDSQDPAITSYCQADSNCMDILPITDLPKRKDAQK